MNALNAQMTLLPAMQRNFEVELNKNYTSLIAAKLEIILMVSLNIQGVSGSGII